MKGMGCTNVLFNQQTSWRSQSVPLAEANYRLDGRSLASLSRRFTRLRHRLTGDFRPGHNMPRAAICKTRLCPNFRLTYHYACLLMEGHA